MKAVQDQRNRVNEDNNSMLTTAAVWLMGTLPVLMLLEEHTGLTTPHFMYQSRLSSFPLNLS